MVSLSTFQIHSKDSLLFSPVPHVWIRIVNNMNPDELDIQLVNENFNGNQASLIDRI